MTTKKLINALSWTEVGVPKVAPDTKRMLIEQRFALQAAVESGDKNRIAAANAEAIRVAGMWGVSLTA